MFKSLICVKQHDITDCGAACLATVAMTHKLKLPITTIRQYAGTDRRGTNVLGMIEAAQHLGFEAKGVKGQWEALATIPLPAIAHVVIGKLLHYVVIHKVTEKKITVADPAKGIVSYTSEEFQKIWSGVLILLTPSATFRAGDKSISVWKRFARLLEPHDFLLAETFLASVFLMVLGLSFSIYLQLLVDKVIAEKNWTMLRWFSLGLVGVVICRAVLGMVRGAFLAYISQKVDVSLMLEYYRHVMKLPAQFFDTRQVGEIISRIGDAVRIREVTSGTTLTVLVDTATMLATFGILCFYSLKLAMLSLLLLPILGVLIHFLNRPLKKYQQATMEGAAGLQSHLVEGLSGVMTFKAFGAEDYVEFKTEKKLVKLLRNLFRATMWGVSASVAGELIIGLGLALIMWSAGAMVINDGLSIGQLVAFYSILLYLFQPMLRLVTVNQSIQAAVVAAERLGEILDLQSEFHKEEGESEKILLSEDVAGEIEFRSINFRYGTRAQVLHDIDLKISPCSIVALVGESGSGKTTLAKLLLRFYEPMSGEIQLGGYDLRDLRLESLRSQIGYVDQDCFLISGTIEENLLMGVPFASLENVVQAIREAGLEAFINSLPNRLQTHIGERGMNISGGQRQRLAIARALLRNPQILILDEATSNLDSQTEQAIQNTIEQLKQHKTIIIIAHRLSTIICADQIVVMEQGRIVQQGTHEELTQEQGKYSDLWQAQMAHSKTKLNGFYPAVVSAREIK